MTNYPQYMNNEPARGAGSGPLNDPGMRMILSISPQDGSLRPLPSDVRVQESQNGTLNVTYPDGSVRQLIPGAEGEGRMITTLADGTRIQSDLTFGEGQVSVSSISSTGEKTLLSLNQNGANMQRVTSDGQVSSFIPDSAPELIESFREVEAFTQEQDFQQQEDFQSNEQFGEWNNYGKPVDWQPQQNWQPPQGDHMAPQTFNPQFGGNGGAYPEYAGNNWVDSGNGSWIAPIQPDAFQQPQQYGEWNNYGKPVDWQPQQNWQPPQGDYMAPQTFNPQFGGNGGAYPEYAGNNWVDNGNGSWIAPIQPDAFQQPQQFGEWNNYGKPVDWQPQQNWQPPQGDYMAPQNFAPQFGGPQFGGPQGIIDTNGYPHVTPVIANDAWGTSVGHYDMKDFMHPTQSTDASGFFKANPTDGSGFPFASTGNAPSFDGSSPIVEIVTSFDEAPHDEWNDPEQAPQQQ